MSASSFTDRLRELQGDGSGRNFAHRIGLSDTTYRSLLKGGSPTLDTLLAIAKGAGVSVAWLAAGEGEKFPRSGQTQSQSQSLALDDGFGSDFAMIPRLDVLASAGHGVHAQDEAHVGLVAFRADWLRRRGINPEAARALTAKGDSMEPTIRDGDILLVDTSIDYVRDNAIYVLVFDGMVLVKRIHARTNRTLMLISDNKDLYPPEEVSASEATSIHVAGRVMWYGRSI